MSCPDVLSLFFVNSILCFAMYFYIAWGIDIISYPAYPSLTLYQHFTVFIRQVVLGLVLFGSAPYFLYAIMQPTYAGIEALCS